MKILIIPIIKLLFFFSLIYFTGTILKSILYYITTYHVLVFLAEFLFNYKQVKIFDQVFLREHRNNQILIITSLITEKLNQEDFFKLVERIKQIPKMRYKLKEFLGDFFWYEDKNYDYKRNLHILHSVNNSEEKMRFIERQFSLKLDMTIPLWQIFFQENFEDNQSMIILKYHHGLGDGISLVSLISNLCDDFQIFKNASLKSVPLYKKVLLFLLSPYYTYKSIPEKEKNFHDPLRKENYLMNGGNIQLAMTRRYSFDKLRQFYKQFKHTTFNDLLWAFLVQAVTKWIRNAKGLKPNEDLTIIGVMGVSGRTSLTKNEMDNQSFGRLVKISAGTDVNLTEMIQRISKVNLVAKDRNLVISSLLLLKLLGHYINIDMFIHYGEQWLNKASFIYTNVQGPPHYVHLTPSKEREIKVNDIDVFLTNATLPFSVLSFTYAGKLKFSLSTNRDNNFSIENLNNYLDKEIENVLIN